MKKEIPDDVAISFSSSFYASLFSGRPVLDSFKIALDMISLTSFDDELIPQIVENNSSEIAKAIPTDYDDKTPKESNGINQNITLVSEEDIEMMKMSFNKDKKLLRGLMAFSIMLSVLILGYTFFQSDDEPSKEFIIGGLIPGMLAYLPVIRVGKKNQSLRLLQIFQQKRNRIIKALSVVSKDEIDKLNEEFYRIVSINAV